MTAFTDQLVEARRVVAALRADGLRSGLDDLLAAWIQNWSGQAWPG
jgi:hypothetical protein